MAPKEALKQSAMDLSTLENVKICVTFTISTFKGSSVCEVSVLLAFTIIIESEILLHTHAHTHTHTHTHTEFCCYNVIVVLMVKAMKLERLLKFQ